MSFKKGKSGNFEEDNHYYNYRHYKKSIIDESTEEILDYLLRSKSVLNDLTFERLRQVLENSLSKRISRIFKNLIKISKIKTKSITLIVFMTIFSALFFVQERALATSTVTIKVPKQNLTVQKNNINSIFELNKAILKNNTNNPAAISEEQKNNLSGVKPGQSLFIIPRNNKTHIVKKGEKITQISSKYNVSVKELIKSNSKVDFINLKAGEALIIPSVKRNALRDHRYKLASRGFTPSVGFSKRTNFSWPVGGNSEISSKFGQRWNKQHQGIDISSRYGNPILAAKSGYVEFAGWKDAYGNCVVINHGSGIKTLYAHASALLVKPGEWVDARQTIGFVGTTGFATGPHLHFEVIVNGSRQNPERYL